MLGSTIANIYIPVLCLLFQGLRLDALTGHITGTPLAMEADTTHVTIQAYNDGGADSLVLYYKLAGVSVVVSENTGSSSYLYLTPIGTVNVPVGRGPSYPILVDISPPHAASLSISPPLPDGMLLNVTSAREYYMTAKGMGCASTRDIIKSSTDCEEAISSNVAPSGAGYASGRSGGLYRHGCNVEEMIAGVWYVFFQGDVSTGAKSGDTAALCQRKQYAAITGVPTSVSNTNQVQSLSLSNLFSYNLSPLVTSYILL